MKKFASVESENRYWYWANEAVNFMKRINDGEKNKHLWGALKCAGACMCEYDRKHEEQTTQHVQRYIWTMAYLKGETSYERYYNSGYFNEKYLKKA